MSQRTLRALVRVTAVLVAALSLSVLLLAQGYLQLAPAEIHTITGPIGPPMPFMAPVACDGGGRLFVLMYQAHQVVRITSQGKVDRVYSLDAVPDGDFKGARGAMILSYAVGGHGSVYEAAVNSKGKAALVKFDSDGDYDEVIDLGTPDLSVRKITAFAGGDLLVSGFILKEEKGGATPEAYTAIFDQYGHLVQNLTLSGDVSLGSSKGKADLPSYSGAPPGVGLEEAIGTGAIGIGYDGNAYVFRNTRLPTVFVVSPSGQVVRRMVLKPPTTGLWPTASSLPVSGSSAAVDYGTLSNARAGTLGQSKLFAVYDMTTGKLVETYKVSPKLKAGFACYTQNAFYFIGARPDGPLTLIQAQPQ